MMVFRCNVDIVVFVICSTGIVGVPLELFVVKTIPSFSLYLVVSFRFDVVGALDDEVVEGRLALVVGCGSSTTKRLFSGVYGVATVRLGMGLSCISFRIALIIDAFVGV